MSLPDTMKSSYTVIRTPCHTSAPTTKTSSVKSCWHCKKQSSSLKQCADCIGIFYCSRECQVTDWKQHKTECTEIFFADMFKLFEVVQMEDCRLSLPKNTVSDDIQDTYFEMLRYMTKIVSLLKNYYKDGHNPCLKKESPYICPVGQNYVHPMYIGEVFGVILYNSSSNPSTKERRVLPDMCYVDYDAISSFVTYYKLESSRLIELATELTKKLSKRDTLSFKGAIPCGDTLSIERSHLQDIQATIKQVTTVAKRSRQFVLYCLQQDLKGVHTYRVIPSGDRTLEGNGSPKTRIDFSEFDDFKIPVTISIQETPQDLIQKLKLDPKHLPYHILIRAKRPVITVEKLPLFHDEFMKHIVS